MLRILCIQTRAKTRACPRVSKTCEHSCVQKVALDDIRMRPRRIPAIVEVAEYINTWKIRATVGRISDLCATTHA